MIQPTSTTTNSLKIHIIPRYCLQFAAFQRQTARNARIPIVKLQFRHQQFGVVPYRQAIAIVQMAPQFAHLQQHATMPHRLLAAQVMAFAHHFVQQVTELPGRNSVLLQRLTQRDRPERMGAMRVECANDGCTGMFCFQWRLNAVQCLADADRLEWIMQRY